MTRKLQGAQYLFLGHQVRSERREAGAGMLATDHAGIQGRGMPG